MVMTRTMTPRSTRTTVARLQRPIADEVRSHTPASGSESYPTKSGKDSRLKTSEELMACKRTAEVYKVDEDTDNISEEEGYPIWDQVEKADEDEVKQFVETTSRLRTPAGTPGLF